MNKWCNYVALLLCTLLHSWGVAWKLNSFKLEVKLQFAQKVINISALQFNSVCCCKETPSTTRWNLDIFYTHYTGISKVVFLSATYTFLTSVCYVKCAYLKQAHRHMLCELDCVMCRGRILYDRLFWKQLLGKNNLISSSSWWRYSNICYCCVVWWIFPALLLVFVITRECDALYYLISN